MGGVALHAHLLEVLGRERVLQRLDAALARPEFNAGPAMQP